MNFHIITIFPEMLRGYFNGSILGRAQKNKIINIEIIDLKKFSENKNGFNKVDDKPFGGGPGMVMKIEPILGAISKIKSGIQNLRKPKIILLSPSGKQFNQRLAKDWARKYKEIIMISGRYEGIDARVKKILKVEEISVGPYVLTGGELPAAIVTDAVSRHIPGVLGRAESLEESRGESGSPLYSKPEVFEYNGKKYKTPKVLLSGHHKKIKEWRIKHSKKV